MSRTLPLTADEVRAQRVLLERAAHAMGYTTDHPMNEERIALGVSALCVEKNARLANTGWNPLEDDGDCARLETALRLNVRWDTDAVTVSARETAGVTTERFDVHAGDARRARRWAAVRCAARQPL